jgi:hypothetical protein
MNNLKNDNNPVPLQNKVIVVAGGSNKAGKAIAEKLAKAGARVIVADVNLINAEVVVQQLMDKYKTHAAAVSLNLSEIKSLVATLKSTTDNSGCIDVWVNAVNKDIHDVFALSSDVADFMKESQTGIIINIIPVTEWAKLTELPDGINADEYLSKITTSLSQKLLTRGIKLFTLSPVDVDQVFSDADQVLPEELAMLVLFCINILAQSTTGKLITLNGKQIFIDSK